MSQELRATAPSPKDRQGWREAVQKGSLPSFRVEDVVAAVQTMLDDNDRSLLNALIGCLSDTLMHALAKRVSKSHRNNGQDIIDRAHDLLIDAVLKPDSPDGTALRKTFWSCFRFRLADAIRREMLDAEREPYYDRDDAGNPIEPADEATWLEIEQSAEVERVLSIIADERKRFAFRLYMDDVPFDSNKGHSISRALGVDESTVRTWIGEVQTQLKQWMETGHDRERQQR